MNLRFVETFIEVARVQSYTQAATNLHIAQPAVSKRIRALQDELGVTLIDRQDKVFYLTEAGERFLPRAKDLLALEKDIQRAFCASRRGPLVLRIGGIETVLHTWLIPLVERLKRERKQPLEFEMNVEMTPVLDKRLRQGSLDLIFSAEPTVGEDFNHETLPPMEMVFVGPASLGQAMSLDALLEWDLLTFQKGSKPYADLVQALRSHNATGKRIHAISSIWAMVKLVESGFGLATLPRKVAEELARSHPIVILESELKLQPLPLYASYRSHPAGLALESAIADALALTRTGADAPHNALWDARVAKACHRLLAAAPEAESSAEVSGQTREKW
jgi:DNA-binding transcriptional LysR family regulator